MGEILETYDMNLTKINIISIKLNINDNLIMYLVSRGEPSLDGGGCPFSLLSRIRIMKNCANYLM